MPLESSPESPQPLRRVAQGVERWVDRLGRIWVEAQLIQVNRRSGSNTIFLTLRDKLGEVSVSVICTPQTLDAAGPPPEGATVVANLKPHYYMRSGRLSFHCDELRTAGEGMLLARLEQTKRLLQAEGLFDPRRKQRLPFLPEVIGLATAAGSAAERDVVHNVTRRWPGATIRTEHALVQGPQSVEQLISAVGRLDGDPQVQVIIIARGGGSLEDLLPFSDEALVRAVFACRTPVVSAIGHEVDSPILDLVADVRASTPTDAAKHVVPEAGQELRVIGEARERLRRAIRSGLRREADALAGLRSRPVLAAPTTTVAIHADQVDQLRERARRTVRRVVSNDETALTHLLARVRAVSPQATLERGYALVLGADGHAVSSVDQVSPGDDLLIHVADGQVTAGVHTTRTAAIGEHDD
ncbi:exodeoxyribonuclease VII large subunit [Propionibacteriaceae bacterium Y2011]